jgi:mannose-6-phosphate isomerase-like protein (cupin superfamily)
MASKFTKIVNYEEALSKAGKSITAVNQSFLQKSGDYEYAVFTLEPHHKQKAHFHTYGDIDIFTIVAGSGYLHLAKIENDCIVPGTEEKLSLKKGDTYCLEPYTLHNIETSDESITVLNIAPGGHSAPAEKEKYQRSIDIFFPLK